MHGRDDIPGRVFHYQILDSGQFAADGKFIIQKSRDELL